MSGPRPFDASFSSSERYTAPRTDEQVVLEVEGEECVGHVLGHNGPRVQVRFELHEDTYVRWFDTADVRAA